MKNLSKWTSFDPTIWNLDDIKNGYAPRIFDANGNVLPGQQLNSL